MIEAEGLVTAYSTRRSQVQLADGTIVTLLLKPRGSSPGYYIRFGNGPFEYTRMGESRDVRLLSSGHLLYVNGRSLFRQSMDGRTGEALENFAADVTIGGGEGDTTPDQTVVPLRVGDRQAGAFNLTTGEHWTVGMSADVDHVHAADYDTIVVRAGGVYRVTSDFAVEELFTTGGHATMAWVPDPVYLIDTSNMTEADYQRWNLGPYQAQAFVVGVNVRTMERECSIEKMRLGGKFAASHLSAIGSALAISSERRGLQSQLEVIDLPGVHLVEPFQIGHVIRSWNANDGGYYDQCKPSPGVGRFLYTVGDDTHSIEIDAPEPDPDPEPEETMSDLDNRKDALDTADPPISYAEEPFSVQAGTKLTITEPDGNTVVEVYDDSGDLIRME